MPRELNRAGRLSPGDKVAIQILRAVALLLGLVGLFLDLTILEVAVGAVVGAVGVGFALLCPRDRYRMVVSPGLPGARQRSERRSVPCAA
jgi:hypothetical protein